MAGNARLFVAALMLAAGLAQAQETLRPEIGKPLQAAQELLKEGKYKDALGKVREADAVSDRTPYENYILDRMRGSAAAGAGDDATIPSRVTRKPGVTVARVPRLTVSELLSGPK